MLDELKPQQQEVARLRQHCVAITCPGAGKTKTIATKAAFLLQDNAANNAAIVGAVTFSKDAAIKLCERILKAAGAAVKKRLIAGTFHSLAFKQLQRPGARPLDIASDGDRLGLVIRLMQVLGREGKAEDVTQRSRRSRRISVDAIRKARTVSCILPTKTRSTATARSIPEHTAPGSRGDGKRRHPAVPLHLPARRRVSGYGPASISLDRTSCKGRGDRHGRRRRRSKHLCVS